MGTLEFSVEMIREPCQLFVNDDSGYITNLYKSTVQEQSKRWNLSNIFSQTFLVTCPFMQSAPFF